MSAHGAARLHAVAAGFEKLGVPALPMRPGRWRLMLVNGRPLTAEARLVDGWLELAAPLALPADRDAPWRLLALAGELPGAVKPVVDGASLGVRAELRADLDEAPLRRRLGEACGALLAAARRLEGGEPAPAADEDEGGGPAAWPALVEELAARRWTARESGAGRWSVELAAEAGTRATAEIEHRESGATTLRAPAVGPGPRSADGRAALADYLLASAATLRLVRAAADGDGGARFETRFASRPEPGEIDEALGALAAAACLAAPAAAALAVDGAVRWYLAVRGRPRGAAPPTPRRRAAARRAAMNAGEKER